MFKADWEKTGELVTIADGSIRDMAAQAFPGRNLQSHAVIAGGCANLNVKLFIEGEKSPLILRIYLRDEAAAGREQAVAKHISPAIPVPQFLYSGKNGEYCFSVVECIEGATLREVLLSREEDALCAVHDAGRFCALLQKYKFPQPGELDANLNVVPGSPPDFVTFAAECLARPYTQAQFGAAKAQRLLRLIEENRAFLPDNSQSFLVHGDYDPANILVRRDGAGWTVSGILDWEFASSGAWLWDVSNMLRYSHLLPATYEGAFLEGLRDGGAVLPPHWRVTMRLMNITSLLYCLRACESGNCPRRVADIARLTDDIADWLESPQTAAG